MNETASVQSDATHASDEQAPTFLEIIIDETASMGGVKTATIAAFNDFINDQKNIENASCQVTMTKFSSSKVSTPYLMIDIATVPRLSSTTYNPNGGTNLYDVIVQRISALSEKIGALKCNVVFLVLTDGEDNMSHIATSDTVRSSLVDKMEHSGWTFVYLGAHARALSEARRMGFPEGNTKAFAAHEIDYAMTAASNATTIYRSARASGAVAVATSSANYFSGE